MYFYKLFMETPKRSGASALEILSCALRVLTTFKAVTRSLDRLRFQLCFQESARQFMKFLEACSNLTLKNHISYPVSQNRKLELSSMLPVRCVSSTSTFLLPDSP